MIVRAWTWLRAHAWLAWIVLGAVAAALLQALTRRRTAPAVAPPQHREADRAAGRAEAHEATAAELHAEAERLEGEARQADEAASREETADHGLTGDDEEIARIAAARLRAGDKR